MESLENLKKENIMPTVQSAQLEATPERQSQVNEQTDRLKVNFDSLHGRINNLTKRLASVLRSPVPPAEGTGKDREELVILAGTLYEDNDSLESAIYKIEDLIGRLEL